MSKELGISQTGSLSGLVRIAGHYSIQMHFALPTLASFFREHAHVQVEHIVREDDLIAPLFERGECDFALLQRPIQKDHYETFFLGHERYILVKSKRYDGRADVYIDSDPTDTLTNDFFAQQVPSKRPKHYHRSFLHNETGIVNAVALGLGRAIVAENELAHRNDLVKVPGYKPFLLPIYLQCSKYMQGSKLFSLLRDALVQGGKRQKGCL
jgi:DNA-binding transcriptional LysR family regulator